MSMSEISVWVLIRRYDRCESGSNEPQSDLLQFSLESGLTYDDLKLLVFRWVDIEDDGSRVVKLRRHDNNLVPLSVLLCGSTRDKPFIIDVVYVHQFCPLEKRYILPDYVEALEFKLKNLAKRVDSAENALRGITSSHIQAVEDVASKLSNCVCFLDRRIDELAPPHWKAQIGSAV